MAKLNVKKAFGTTVREWRNHIGISQGELAERADLHRTYVSDVERGMRNISLKNIERLARALNISVPALFRQPNQSEWTGHNSHAQQPRH
jgi:transcriptional regulator with XRE-family HTH domain